MKSTYTMIIKASPKTEGEHTMWSSIELISQLIEELQDIHPEMANKFKRKQYEMLNGKHFNEDFAIDEVRTMRHKDVCGEMITDEEVRRMHSDPLTIWDAYVGYNAILHDMAESGIERNALLVAAEHFWFMDDDFSPRNEKVWWYFSNK